MPHSSNRRTNLLKALQSYVPCNAEEVEHRNAMTALLGVDGDPFCRAHVVPGHFTASAFVLNPDETSIALILHGKLKRWLQPGGHIETADSNPLAAATREAQEETGLLDVTPVRHQLFDLDVHMIPSRPEAAGHEHFDLRFLFRTQTVTKLQPNDEVTDARWVPLDEIASWDSDASVVRAVQKVQQSVQAGR